MKDGIINPFDDSTLEPVPYADQLTDDDRESYEYSDNEEVYRLEEVEKYQQFVRRDRKNLYSRLEMYQASTELVRDISKRIKAPELKDQLVGKLSLGDNEYARFMADGILSGKPDRAASFERSYVKDYETPTRVVDSNNVGAAKKRFVPLADQRPQHAEREHINMSDYLVIRRAEQNKLDQYKAYDFDLSKVAQKKSKEDMTPMQI